MRLPRPSARPRRLLVAAALSAAFLLLMAFPGPLVARDATITLKDGRTITGELVAENDTEVRLRIATVETPFRREDIRGVEFVPSLEEQYRSRRSSIGDDDLAERVRLAQWLYDKGAYPLAKRELDDLAKRFPKDAAVAELKAATEGKLAEASRRDNPTRPPRPAGNGAPLQTTQRTPTPGPDATGEPEEAAESAAGERPDPNTRLTPEQLNLIRVYLVDLDARPNVIVPRDVLTDVFRRYAGSDLVPRSTDAQNAIRAAPGFEQLGLLFDLKAREYYDKVEVRNDPPVLRDFRVSIHQNYILNYCGSVQCHGGGTPGGLGLYLGDPNTDRTLYSNFLILDRYENDRGYMIDRERPEDSYLVQYMLPRDQALFPHPRVRGRDPRPHLTAGDPRYSRLVDWVGSLGRTRYDYGLRWQPPGASMRPAATRPAGGEGVAAPTLGGSGAAGTAAPGSARGTLGTIGVGVDNRTLGTLGAAGVGQVFGTAARGVGTANATPTPATRPGPGSGSSGGGSHGTSATAGTNGERRPQGAGGPLGSSGSEGGGNVGTTGRRNPTPAGGATGGDETNPVRAAPPADTPPAGTQRSR